MEAEIQKYLDLIKADYARWHDNRQKDAIQQQISDEMVKEFNSKLRIDQGSKYIKVVSNGGAHSFIMTKDDGKFRKGDVLKSASWAAPARNFARGNILDGTANPSWTGVV